MTSNLVKTEAKVNRTLRWFYSDIQNFKTWFFKMHRVYFRLTRVDGSCLNPPENCLHSSIIYNIFHISPVYPTDLFYDYFSSSFTKLSRANYLPIE